MQSNLKKLILKLKKLRGNCAIPVKTLNELNQIVIALHRAGYEGQHEYKKNHIAEVKKYCFYECGKIQKFPIGLSVYNCQGEDLVYLVVNWDVTEPCHRNNIFKF